MTRKIYPSSSLFIVLFLCICQFPKFVNAQNEAQIFQIGAQASESIELLASISDGLIIGGLYNGAFDWNGFESTPFGENDFFLAKQQNQKLEWIQFFGSSGQDEILALASDQEDNILLCISYLHQIQLGDSLLVPSTGSRGLALLKMDSNGSILWLKDISSTDEQVVSEIVVDNANQIYLVGYFGGTLNIDGTSMSARAENDLLFAKLSPNGQLIWMQQAGLEGLIRGQSLALNSQQNALNISGTFKGVLDFPNDTIQTNTLDFDVFVLQIDSSANILWGRKVGGVYEDRNTQIISAENDEIFVIGDFQGVLKLDETWTITTSGIQDNNLYILKYDRDGNALWARSIGGLDFDFAQDAILLNSNQIAITGYFQNEFLFDSFSAQSEGNFNSFVLALSTEDGQAKWLESIQGNDLVVANNLALYKEQLIVGGSFTNVFSYGSTEQESLGFFDAFLIYLEETLTPVSNPLSPKNSFRFFPNPASHALYIETLSDNYLIQIVDASGRLFFRGKNNKTIPIETWANGLYFVKIENLEGKNTWSKIVVQH